MRAQPMVPPHDIEAEQSVLGGLLLRNSVFDDVSGIVAEGDFYRSDHQAIFAAIAQMIAARKPCDYVTLKAELQSAGKLDEAGGGAYLAQLAVDTYSVANILAYAGVVKERSMRRRLISAGNDLGDMGYRPGDRTPEQLLEQAEQKIFAMRSMREQNGGLRPLTDFVQQAEGAIEALHRSEVKLGGISTGFQALDTKIDGLHGGDLVVVAGNPGTGKTVLAVNIAKHFGLRLNRRAAIFSMEMQGRQVAVRVLSDLSRVPLNRLRGGRMENTEWDKLVEAGAAARTDRILLDEEGALSPLQVRARARRAVQRGGLSLIVIDYLQLMRVQSKENTTNKTTEIAESLKALAKELDVPVIALSQLSRDGAKENRRPRLEDLRDSGGIGQAADVVAFVHREQKPDGGLIDGVGAAEIIIAKQRQGETGTVRLNFFGACCRFEDMSPQDELDFREEKKRVVEPSRGFGRMKDTKSAAAGDA